MNGFEVPLKQSQEAAVHEKIHEKPSFANVLRELI